MLVIDGKRGEGGGQVLRTSLALSLATEHPDAEITATQFLGPDQVLDSGGAPLVDLGVSPAAGSLTLGWPVVSAGYTLQSRTNLAQGNWKDHLTLAPALVGNEWQFNLPMTEAATPSRNDTGVRDSKARRSGLPGPSRCVWPITSSRHFGRSSSASGAWGAEGNRSATRPGVSALAAGGWSPKRRVATRSCRRHSPCRPSPSAFPSLCRRHWSFGRSRRWRIRRRRGTKPAW